MASDVAHCGGCRMFNRAAGGRCWGYGNVLVDPLYVCDSFEPSMVELDDAGMAPLSGGAASETGLQMTPTVQGFCECGEKLTKRGRCKACGAQPKRLDAPVPITVSDRVRRSADNLELVGPQGTVTADRVAPDDGAIIYDVAWDDGTRSSDVREFHLRRLDATTEPTARWFDRLLSQDRLGDAFDGARAHIEASVGPAALSAARHVAHQAAEGIFTGGQDPPADLVDALTRHYTDMYHLGHQTVRAELARQRQHLKRQLDDPASDTAAGAGASRLARARQRGEHSARNIINRVGEVLARQQITGLKDATALQTTAEAAATRQLHQEALTNTAAMVNDGRYDSAMNAGDVVGGVYTSVMDERSCDPCIAADTGDILPPEQAILMGPPNPDCAGADYCRCAIVWTLSTDPAAFAGV